MFRKFRLLFIAAAMLSAIVIAFLLPSSKTEVMAVHENVVFVKNFPKNDIDMITWWDKNQSSLIKNNDPHHLTIVIMDFGSGYEKEPQDDFIMKTSPDDDLCFDSIKDEKRCLKKNQLMMVTGDVSKKIFYVIGNKIYSKRDNGEIYINYTL